MLRFHHKTQTAMMEEWTPDMERKRKLKEQKLLAPPFKTTVQKNPASFNKPRASSSKKRKKQEPEVVKEEQREGYNFKQNGTTNFMNLEPPDDDSLLYCEECNKEYDMDCPVHGPLNYIQDAPVSNDADPERALHTLPRGLVVKESSIPGAGLGVFTEEEIPARVKFGPYGGVKVTNKDTAHSSGYCWQIYKDGKPSHFVDALEKTSSNWMRYVNCAVSESEQNLVAFQFKGAIYYRTFKTISPGKELLVYYGDEYAKDLIRNENYFIRPGYAKGTVYYPCLYCDSSYSTDVLFVKHLLRVHGCYKLKPTDIQILDCWLRRNGYRRQNNITSINTEGINNNLGDSNLNSSTKCLKYATQNLNKTGEKPYKCTVCEFACNRKFILDSHMRIHTGEKPYKCTVCEFACITKSNLVTHMRIHTGEKPYKCTVCEFECYQKSNLVTHMRIHTGEKPYKCTVCEFACNQKAHLVTHMRIHTGEKPYKCTVCEFACNTKSDLVRHKGSHTGEKPYKCTVCEFACNRKFILDNHMRIHTGEKPYKCTVCEFACNTKSYLVTHMQIHTGEKPYKCTVCEFACNTKSNLVTHMRIHTGEKPYKCTVCEFACKTKSNLVKHMRIHTGEKPYKCTVCEFACKDKSLLSTHMLTHIGE